MLKIPTKLVYNDGIKTKLEKMYKKKTKQLLRKMLQL